MDNPRSSAAPIFAALFLLLPVLYLGSYLVLVVPEGVFVEPGSRLFAGHYRMNRFGINTKVFWPLEQLDRKLRPTAWHDRRFESIYSPAIQE
jgi:hypothetical protein